MGPGKPILTVFYCHSDTIRYGPAVDCLDNQPMKTMMTRWREVQAYSDTLVPKLF